MGDFDAVVGGGPNGLSAALRLAEAGWSVCLVEANQDVGGSARTLECTLAGFHHDLEAGFLTLAMIAALDPQLVIRLAGPDAFPSRSLAQVQRYRRGLGTFKVDWRWTGPSRGRPRSVGGLAWSTSATRSGP